MSKEKNEIEYIKEELGGTKLFDGFFLGDSQCATDSRFIANHKIRVVVFVSSDKGVIAPKPGVDNIQYFNICWRENDPVYPSDPDP